MDLPEHIKSQQSGNKVDSVTHEKSTPTAVADKFRSEINSLTPQLNNNLQSLSDSFTVVKEMAQGAADEITHHPAQLLSEAIVGAGLGTLAKYPKVALGLAAAAVGTTAGLEYYKTGGISGTVDTFTKSTPPDFQEKPEGPNENRERGAQYLDKGVQLASAFLAYKLLGRIGKSAGAAAMDEVAAVHSGEHLDPKIVEEMTKLTKLLNSHRVEAAGEFKVQTGASIFEAPAQPASVRDGRSFVPLREMRLPKISDGPQFDFLKTKG